MQKSATIQSTFRNHIPPNQAFHKYTTKSYTEIATKRTSQIHLHCHYHKQEGRENNKKVGGGQQTTPTSYIVEVLRVCSGDTKLHAPTFSKTFHPSKPAPTIAQQILARITRILFLLTQPLLTTLIKYAHPSWWWGEAEAQSLVARA